MRVTPYLVGALVLGAVSMAPAVARARTTAPVAPAATAKVALDDPTIVAIFDAANTLDIEASTIGEKKATTKEIRDLAAMFIHDHTAVRQQGRDLAKKLNVTPTPPKDFPLAASHAEAMKKLNATSGKDFDRVYLENEVAFHKAVIDAINGTLLPATQNAEVKDLEKKVAPAFQAHMMAAQRLLDGLTK